MGRMIYREFVVAAGVLPLVLASLALVPSAVLSQPVVTDFGGKSPKVEKADSSSDFGRYLAAVERKISGGAPSKFIGRVVVKFTIAKNGSVSNIKLDKSSSMPQIDSLALDAVKKSQPLDELPTSAGKSVDIQYTFEGTSQGTTGHAIRTH